MFGKNDDEPTFEEFIKSRDKHLDKIIDQNNKDLTDLIDKRDPGINNMIEDVYKDFSERISSRNTITTRAPIRRMLSKMPSTTCCMTAVLMLTPQPERLIS